jgi:hypothetical protein
MKHSAMYVAVGNLLRTLPRRRLSIMAVIMIGWILRQLFRWDRRDEDYAIRAYKDYYVDPANLYKYYGSYGRS